MLIVAGTRLCVVEYGGRGREEGVYVCALGRGGVVEGVLDGERLGEGRVCSTGSWVGWLIG